MKRIVNLMLVLTLLLAMLTVGTLHAAAADPAPAGETVECEQALYVETFDKYEASADTEAVLAALGWKKLTVEGDKAPQETNALFEIKDGKLYFTNYVSGSKDGYYEITALSGEFMKDIFAKTYTVQYDVTYTDASTWARYANILTEYTTNTETGTAYYNTAHLRIGGYGNNQCRYADAWVTYDHGDANDLFAAQNTETETNTTIYKKLFGKDIQNGTLNLKDITVTVRVVYDLEKGPSIYVKTPDMAEFIQVSQYSAESDGAAKSLWKAWEGESVVFKLATGIDGWIDNIYLWQGDGEIAHDMSDWSVASEADCFNKRVEKRTCSDCDMVETRLVGDVVAHNWSDWTVSAEADCLNQGEEKRTCSLGCKSVETRVVGEALGHEYGEDDKCIRCGQDKYSKGLTYKLTSGTYTVTGLGTCTDTEIRIPPTYEGKVVSKIDADAFKNNTNITRISIPDTVTNIETEAFNGCINLIYNEDENAKYLGNDENPYLVLISVKNTNLTSFEFHSGTKIIYNKAFYNCNKLEVMNIPEGITQILSYAFQNCTSLKTVSIPATMVEKPVYNFVFYNCNNLTSLTVAADNPVYHSTNNCIIRTADNTLVYGCKYSVIPAGGEVTTIGTNAFCKFNFDTFYIPAGVTTISSNAFQSCSNLESVIIDVSVTNIVNKAFRNCTNLKMVYYTGTAEDWANITIGETDNQYLLAATVVYYSETQPTEAGLYWHYVDGEPTVWHYDLNKDHVCECGCDVAIGEHADSAYDGDHVCDYGCGAVLGECVPEEDDGDCTTDVVCADCGAVLEEGASEHVYETIGDTMYCTNCDATYKLVVISLDTIDTVVDTVVDTAFDVVGDTIDSMLDVVGETIQSAVDMVYDSFSRFFSNMLSGY